VTCVRGYLLYKIPHVVVGENHFIPGSEQLLESRGVNVEVLNDPECIQMMEDFIEKNPDLWNGDIASRV